MLIKNFAELAKTPQKKTVLEIIEAGLSAIQPENVIPENFELSGNILKIKSETFDLSKHHRIFILGFGKGSAEISRRIGQILGNSLTEGFVIDVEVPTETSPKIHYSKGAHPLPSQSNLDFTKKVVDKFENKLTQNDLVIVVVTGGGSSLFELPHSLTLEELIKKNDELLKSGLTIEEMNIERKKMSKVKGGGLAKILHPAKVLSLIFSDVPGNDLSVVASGPTVRPARHASQGDAGGGVNADEEKYFENVSNILMLSNQTALSAMEKKAMELGISATIYSDKFQADAREAGKTLIEACHPGSILLAGGETTVKVTGKGKGGRNQEVVLSSLSELDDRTIIVSLDSDGWDNNEFAGAIGDKKTVDRAQSLGLSTEEYLDNNDSFSFFEKVGDGISTGRLPSNVSDLFIVYKFS